MKAATRESREHDIRAGSLFLICSSTCGFSRYAFSSCAAEIRVRRARPVSREDAMSGLAHDFDSLQYNLIGSCVMHFKAVQQIFEGRWLQRAESVKAGVH